MAYSPNSLVEIIEQNKNKKLIATKIIENNPKILPILPKLISSRSVNTNAEHNDRITFNKGLLETIHNKINNLRNNNKNIIKLFPDIELAIQILISSILSPKKMTDIQLNFKLDKKLNMDPTIIADVVDSVKEYILTEYELEEKLPEILREALFASGAYALAVIPESSVDEVINTDLLASYSTEDFKQRSDILLDQITRPVNILNIQQRNKPLPEKGITLENFAEYLTSQQNVLITDNVNVLKFSRIKEKINKSLISSSLRRNVSISQESMSKLDYLDIFRRKESISSVKDIETIKLKTETKRKSIGKPMVIKIPTESIIPVFIPGNETEHIGYFVLLDENGKPLNSNAAEFNVERLNNIVNTTNTQSVLSPVQKAYNNLVMDNTKDVDVNKLFEIYKDILEKQLYNSIRNSLYGSDVEISNKNDIYFLMFTRALSEQKTSLLYIPKELLVYFAFYYNEIGIGKSLLENLSILSSLRAILLFSKVMAYAKQSIDVTKVNISLDPNDPDPEKTIEQVQDSVLKLRQNFFPLGINNPIDLVNWIQRAGLQFSYENNPLLPNIKIDFENANISHTVPNSDLEEELRKQTIIALGLSPETIDNGFSPEFATTVVNNNILLSKRIALYQKTLTKHLSKLVSIIIYNDEELRNILRKVILEKLDPLTESFSDEEKEMLTKDKASFIEYFIDKLGEHLYIDLPKPENTNIANLSVEFDAYKENLEKVIDSVISTDIFSENISGELSAHIDTIKNIYKHHLLRQWMSNNNFYPEVLELSLNNKEEVDHVLNFINNHLVHTMRNSAQLLNIVSKFKEAVSKDIQNLNSEEPSMHESSSEPSDSSAEEGEEGEQERNNDFGGIDLDL
jgi:hypothetical protein